MLATAQAAAAAVTPRPPSPATATATATTAITTAKADAATPLPVRTLLNGESSPAPPRKDLPAAMQQRRGVWARHRHKKEKHAAMRCLQITARRPPGRRQCIRWWAGNRARQSMRRVYTGRRQSEHARHRQRETPCENVAWMHTTQRPPGPMKADRITIPGTWRRKTEHGPFSNDMVWNCLLRSENMPCLCGGM